MSLPRLDHSRLSVIERTLKRLVETNVIAGAALGVGDGAGNRWFATSGNVVALLTAEWWLPYQRYAEVVNSVMGARRA